VYDVSGNEKEKSQKYENNVGDLYYMYKDEDLITHVYIRKRILFNIVMMIMVILFMNEEKDGFWDDRNIVFDT
jgi:hypothetical protein